jgi:hypothetical protein
MSEPWIPVRYVHHEVACCSCFESIPRGAPGARVGERGTRAWMLKGAVVTNVRGQVILGPTLFECCPCHDEGTRAELATQA